MFRWTCSGGHHRGNTTKTTLLVWTCPTDEEGKNIKEDDGHLRSNVDVADQNVLGKRNPKSYVRKKHTPRRLER